MSSSEKEPTSTRPTAEEATDTMAFRRFNILAVLTSGWSVAIIALIFMGRMDIGLGVAAMSANLNLFMTPPSINQRKGKEGAEAQAIALPGSVVSQTVEGDRRDESL